MYARTPILGAAVLLALAVGCKREEKPTVPAPSPQTAPQPATPVRPAPGSSTEPGRTATQTVDDATITAKVKGELLKAPDVKGTDVNVDTVNGTVTLKGTVDASAQIDRAESIARRVEGVKNVQNMLTAKTGK